MCGPVLNHTRGSHTNVFVQIRQFSIVCYQHLPRYLCLHITTLRVSFSETFGAVSYLLQHGEKSADLILLYATKTQTRVWLHRNN